MVKLDKFGNIVDEKHVDEKDHPEEDLLNNIPEISSEELGFTAPTKYQRFRTYLAKEIAPKFLNIKHKIQDLYKK